MLSRNGRSKSINEVHFSKISSEKKKWSFLKHQKKKSVLSFIRKKILIIIKNSTGPSPSNQTKKEGNPVEFLPFRVYNSMHPITTGMNPIRNMNHKRKYLLNRSQEYQLQYLLAKEESFQ
uniref:Uncharacterized protein n=3 Tax=Camellia TaxID=4441 RepID=A0A2R2Q224_9ERIC|nr:hypothetical protein LCE14_pgp040 [Camellia debaoensis]ANF99765.1 hypothetical protein [Camellia japonica]QSJ55679.1 hypothetical protein [Camellia pubipetala]QBI38200.1 hypothetical protein [Camellia japonica]QBI38291.1 hypothetical protein [Camellia japonica]QSJ55762.1 hypothetical protein [Camellia debaoensis]